MAKPLDESFAERTEDSQQQRREKLQQEDEEKEKLHEQKTKSNKRILVVDDEPDICMVYQMVLEDTSRYECKSYTDPVKALKEFRPNYYHLILLDIKMPVLNGFEICKKIREVDKTVQIIFITAAEESFYKNFVKQYYPQLSNDINIKYVQKPIGNEELLQIVNTMISNSIIID